MSTIIDDLACTFGVGPIRGIPEASQLHISEFIESHSVIVHVWRLDPSQYTAMVNGDLRWDFKDRLILGGYERAKEFARSEFERLGLPPLVEPKIKRMSPTAWYGKQFQCERPSHEIERFGIWYASKFGVIIEPTAILQGDEIPALYAELPTGIGPPMGSCMTGPDRSRFTVVYGTSPRCRMAIHRRPDGKCDERTMLLLPDDLPEDTPIGPGWWHSRIYNWSNPDESVDRAILGPWLTQRGIKSVTCAQQQMTVSGFTLGPDLYLPYVDKDYHVRFVWDDNERNEGDPVRLVIGYDHGPSHPRHLCYPSSAAGHENNFHGGPRSEPAARCCNCGCDIEEAEDIRTPEDGSDTWCESCYDDTFTYCEASGCDARCEDMIPVRNCYSYESASRYCDGFMARRTGRNEERIRYRRITLIDGDDVFVPECEIVDGEFWIEDIEDNGYTRKPYLDISLGRDGGMAILSPNFHRDEDEWEYCGDGVSYETTDGDRLEFHNAPWRVGMVISIADAFGLTPKFDNDRCVLRFFHSDGSEWRPCPVVHPEYARLTIDGQPVAYDPYNTDHHRHLCVSMIRDYVFTPVNPNTPDTGETASTL